MLCIRLQPNIQAPHSAPLGQHHQLNVRPVTHLRVQANGKAAGHLAHLARVDRGIPLQLVLGHALVLKCTGSLNDAPLQLKRNQQGQSPFHLKLS